MKKIVQHFIDNSFLVNILSFFMVVIGLTSLLTMKRDLIPRWQNRTIFISASFSGATPDQVEEFLTSPIEDSIASFAGIDEITSTSYQGGLSLTVSVAQHFDENDTNDLFQKIQSKVNGLAGSLPDGVDDLKVENNTMTSFWFTSLSAIGYDFRDPKHRAWLLATKESLRKLPGIVSVADNSPWPSLTIKLNPEKAARYQLKPFEVMQVIRSRFDPLPIGSYSEGQKSILVTLKAEVKDPEQLSNVIIKGNASGTVIRLKDIATLDYGFGERKTKRTTNGKSSAGVWLFKDLDTDTLMVKAKLEALMENINKSTPEGVELLTTGDGPAYIERQLSVLKNNGAMGLVLVIFALFLFLGGRSAVMTCFGLPMAYLATFIVLNSMGITINIISVVGMILILGILVDDAIIVSEQYTQFLEKGFKPREAAAKAVQTTMIPITGTIITTIVAFLPILMNKGGLSEFLYAIPWVVIAALVMSWFESFFILPNHLAHFVKKPPKKNVSRYMDKLKSVYAKMLTFVLKWRYPMVAIFFGFLVFSIWFAAEKVPIKYDLHIGSEKIRIQAELKSSQSLEETEKKLKPLQDLLNKIDPKKYSYLTGNLGQAWIDGKDKREFRYATMDIRFDQTFPDIEETKDELLAYLEKELPKVKNEDFAKLHVEKKIDGQEDLKNNTVSLFITGRDFYNAEKILETITEELKTFPETKKVDFSSDLFNDAWNLEVNQTALQQFGIPYNDLAAQLANLIQKQEIREFKYEGQMVRILSEIERPENLNKEKLDALPIVGNYGRLIPAGQLGEWTKSRGMNSIQHIDLEKTLIVNAEFDEEKIKLEKYIEKIEGQFPKFQKEFPRLNFSAKNADKEAEKNKASMIKMLVYCIGLILLVLALVLNSLLQPLLIGLAIPFGVIGVIWAFYFHGEPIRVMGIVGIIGMAGVVVNDSLIMVDTINKMRKNWLTFPRESVIKGAVSRLRPILLTSITTLGGVFPMAYGLGGDAGFTKPLALSMGWGLLFSTLLTLFLLPCFLEIQRNFMVFYSKKFPKSQDEELAESAESPLPHPVEKPHKEESPQIFQ